VDALTLTILMANLCQSPSVALEVDDVSNKMSKSISSKSPILILTSAARLSQWLEKTNHKLSTCMEFEPPSY
jgi:hypothetical protein